MPAGVDAAHELLAEEAALGERHRVALEERLLRDRRLVDVDALARDARLDAQRLVRVGVDSAAPASTSVGTPRRSPRAARRRRRRRRRPSRPQRDDRSTSTPSRRSTASAPRTATAATSPVRSSISTFTRIGTGSSACRERRAEAGLAVEPPLVVADARRAEVDVELALRRAAAARARPRRRRPGRGPATRRLWRNEVASGPDDDDDDRASDARRQRVVLIGSAPVRRASASRRGRGRCGEQRPRLVAAFQVFVGRDRSRRRSRRRPARSPGRRARPSCGSRSRCRGCRRSRRSRRRPRTARASSARARR